MTLAAKLMEKIENLTIRNNLLQKEIDRLEKELVEKKSE